MENWGPDDDPAMESSGSSSDASMSSLDWQFLAGAPAPPADPFDQRSPREPEQRLDLAAVDTRVHGKLLRDMTVGELQAAFQYVSGWRMYHQRQRWIHVRTMIPSRRRSQLCRDEGLPHLFRSEDLWTTEHNVVYHLSEEAHWQYIQARVQAFLLDRLGPHDLPGYLKEYPEWTPDFLKGRACRPPSFRPPITHQPVHPLPPLLVVLGLLAVSGRLSPASCFRPLASSLPPRCVRPPPALHKTSSTAHFYSSLQFYVSEQ